MNSDISLHTGDSVELTIHALAGLGDGIGHYSANGASHDKKTSIFVPFSAPGDVLKVRITSKEKNFYHAEIIEIITPGKSRTTPACRHYQHCGGCSLQHVDGATYTAYKHGILADILKRLGAPENVLKPLLSVGAGARRRCEWKVMVNKGVVSLGYLAPKSHSIIPITECPVLDPVISALIAPLAQTLSALKKPSLIKAVQATRLHNGLEILLHVQQPLPAAARETLKQAAPALGIIRIAESADAGYVNIYHTLPAEIACGNVIAELPAGAFLQASAMAQQMITTCILKHTKGYDRVVDLYAGCGTYSLPLAERGHHVHAYEGSVEMIQALHNTLHRHGFANRMGCTARDLFTTPLTPHELNRFDAAVINPPRNGAQTQVQHLAASELSRVVMISCNPATFERDARILAQSGFRMHEAIPIDQFYWTPHLEIAACFIR